MHRSASTSRASEEQFYSHHGTSPPPSKPSPGLRIDANELPVYDPLSDLGKKERMRIKFAENAVHIIPLVLVLCAVTLWFFSNTVDVMNKDGSIVARVEGLTIDSDIDVHGSETSLLTLDREDMDPPKHKAVVHHHHQPRHHHKGGTREKSY